MSETFDDINDRVALIMSCYVISFILLVINIYGFLTPEFWWFPAVTALCTLLGSGILKFFFRDNYIGFWQTTHFDALFWGNVMVSALMPIYVWFNLIRGEQLVILSVAGLMAIIMLAKSLKGAIYAAKKKPLYKIIL
ncbi:hypothetical protein [Vibrio crassostreae]|uniref:hypothetical protein n=1 Tax=Vibrio crassostreae TaxID=246167 RepID=UPI001B3169DE|nr:hypothetical protein [Vibrio crassostreae]